MPAHFGKYNFAICRRLSRAALFREQGKHDLNTNGNGNSNGNSSTGLDSNGASPQKRSKKEKKSKSKKGASENGDQPGYQAIDFERANEEMNNFIAILRMLNVDVIELCPDETLSYDSVFIGDAAITINGLALLCRPRGRQNEINEIKQIIKRELNLPIIEINDESALLNGGDVLWTGREIFVGLSNETNEAGARAVAAAFPEFSVTPVKVPPKDNLRLKSFVTMAGPDILCANKSPEAQQMIRRMEREASHRYKLITLYDESASNVLYLNGTLMHRNDLPESVAILQDKIDYSRVPVKMSELARNNPYHGIDSLCLLVRKSHKIQTIV